MKAVQFTCVGGPLDGVAVGPVVVPDKWPDVNPVLCQHQMRRGKIVVRGAGRYQIAADGATITATHVAGPDDIAIPPEAPVLVPEPPTEEK